MHSWIKDYIGLKIIEQIMIIMRVNVFKLSKQAHCIEFLEGHLKKKNFTFSFFLGCSFKYLNCVSSDPTN